jgi:site-specific DNA recombinase
VTNPSASRIWPTNRAKSCPWNRAARRFLIWSRLSSPRSTGASGSSGARLNRPGLDRLRDAAETGAIDAVWCLSPDRLARSYAYQILILDEFARYQVPVRFADAPPLDDPQGRLLVQIQGVIAEHERAKFAERGRRGKLYRSRAGEVLATKIPYGYRRVPRGPDGAAHLIIHEPEAALVRRIFADFLAGDTLRHLAVALSAEGIASPEGKPVWRLSTICRLLRNEAYAGRLYWNRTQTSYDPALGRTRATLRPREEWIEIPIPAIIDEATLEAVAATARDNSSYSPRRTEPDTFLLRCAHCQVKLNCYRARRNNTTTRYYLCPHRDPWRAGGAEHRCPERRVRADELDTFVFDQVRQLLIRPDLITAGQTAVAAHTPAPDDELLTAQLARLQRRLQNAHTERGRVADLYQAGVIDNPEMTRRCREIDTRCRRLAQEHQTLTARQSELAADNRLSASIANFAQHAQHGINTLDFQGRQQLLRLVLEDVRVQGWNVELRLRIPLDDNPPTAARTGNRGKARTSRTRHAKEAVSSNDHLRSTTERAQERPERRGGPDPTEDPIHPAVAQQGHVIDRVRPGDHPRDQRRHLQMRVHATAFQDPHMVGDQVLEPSPLGQPQDRREPGTRHEVRVVERDGEVVAHSHLPDAFLRGLDLSREKIDSPATEGHSGFTTRTSPQPERWIQA